jgi:hypothetical protein
MTTPAESRPPHESDATSGSDTESDSGGQVSEVASFKEPGEQISPEDSVAGAPEGESGKPDEGPTGPDAVTNDSEQKRYPEKSEVETTG